MDRERWGAHNLRVTIVAMPRDCVVRRKARFRSPVGGGARGTVTRFSVASRRRLMMMARNLVGLTHMITVTYPGDFPTDGRRVKADLAKLRKWLVWRGLSGLWIIEWQERGAPHFHLFCTGGVDKDELRMAWSRIVAGYPADAGLCPLMMLRTRVELLRSGDAVGGYCAKYGAKLAQKQIPEEYRDVGRLWARFGGIELLREELVSVPAEVVAPVVRVVRRAYQSARRGWKCKRVFRDEGRRTFTAYGMGPVARRFYCWWERDYCERLVSGLV